jgi:hypothetical protein
MPETARCVIDKSALQDELTVPTEEEVGEDDDDADAEVYWMMSREMLLTDDFE